MALQEMMPWRKKDLSLNRRAGDGPLLDGHKKRAALLCGAALNRAKVTRSSTTDVTRFSGKTCRSPNRY